MRIYKPTETHIALYPEPNQHILTCSTPGCGVRFASRIANSANEDEDQSKCLSCNRAQWSRLWNGNKSITTESTIGFDLTPDIDVGEVVSIRRMRR